jgi:hypothetical protein
MIDEIDSREALVGYLKTLLEEVQSLPDEPTLLEAANGVSGWNNMSLYSFLEAMTAAIEAHGSTGNWWPAEDDPRVWRAIAEVLEAGKTYE